MGLLQQELTPYSAHASSAAFSISPISVSCDPEEFHPLRMGIRANALAKVKRKFHLPLPFSDCRGGGWREGDTKSFGFPTGVGIMPYIIISGSLAISGGTFVDATASCFWSKEVGIRCPGQTVSHTMTPLNDFCFLQTLNFRKLCMDQVIGKAEKTPVC